MRMRMRVGRKICRRIFAKDGVAGTPENPNPYRDGTTRRACRLENKWRRRETARWAPAMAPYERRQILRDSRLFTAAEAVAMLHGYVDRTVRHHVVSVKRDDGFFDLVVPDDKPQRPFLVWWRWMVLEDANLDLPRVYFIWPPTGREPTRAPATGDLAPTGFEREGHAAVDAFAFTAYGTRGYAEWWALASQFVGVVPQDREVIYADAQDARDAAEEA